MQQSADEHQMVLPPPLPLPLPLPETLPPQRPYPGFWQAMGLFVLYVVGTAIVVIPFAVADAIAKTSLTKSPWVLGVATLFGALFAAQVGRSGLGLSWREVAGPFRIPAAVIPPMASMMVGQLILTMMVLFWLLRLFPGLMPKETYGLDKSLIGAAFALMISAPLGEELLFRGIFLRGFIPRYGMYPGILLGAAIFAAAHMNPGKLFGTFLLGATFGWWYTKMGSIWPGVIGHALNNGVPVLVAIFAAKSDIGDQKVPPFNWAEPVFALIGLALLAQGGLAMRRYFEAHSEVWES